MRRLLFGVAVLLGAAGCLGSASKQNTAITSPNIKTCKPAVPVKKAPQETGGIEEATCGADGEKFQQPGES